MRALTRRLGLPLAAAPGLVLLAAAPASAHPLHGGTQPRDWTQVVGHSALGAVLLLGTTVVAGLLWAPRLTGPPAAPARWRVALTSAAAATLTANVAITAFTSLGTPFDGWRPVLPLQVALLGLAAIRVRTRLPGPSEEAIGVAMLMAVAFAGNPGGGAVLAVGLAHLLGAAAWAGGTLAVAIAPGAPSRAVAARRFTPWAAGAALITVATGVANLHLHLPVLNDLVATGYGQLVLAKLAAVAVVLALGGVALKRRHTNKRPPVRTESAALGLVLLLAAGLVAFPSSAPASGVPMLRLLRLAGAPVTVLVTPNRPGPNLVHVVTAGTIPIQGWLGDRPLALEPAAGENGETAAVTLPSGTTTLRFAAAGSRARKIRWKVSDRPDPGPRLVTTVALTGDGECLSRHIGEVIAVAERDALGGRQYQLSTAHAGGCSSQLPAQSFGATYAHFLHAAGARTILVVADRTARSTAMANALAQRGAELGLSVHLDPAQTSTGSDPPVDAIVVTTGWPTAAALLTRLAAASNATRGVFLAPWLLDGVLFEQTITSGRAPPAPEAADLHLLVVDRTQLTVGSTLDPTSPEGGRYLAALARWAPGEAPSAAGFEGYEAIRAQIHPDQISPATGLQFFTPTRAAFLPPALSAGHADLPPGAKWITGGTLAPVSGVLALRG